MFSNSIRIYNQYSTWALANLKKNQKNLGITVEVRNLVELDEVLERGGINRIMFDNFSPERMKKAVEFVANRYETEASGGINLDNVRQYAETGVDYISVGAITHSSLALDISMDIVVTKPV